MWLQRRRMNESMGMSESERRQSGLVHESVSTVFIDTYKPIQIEHRNERFSNFTMTRTKHTCTGLLLLPTVGANSHLRSASTESPNLTSNGYGLRNESMEVCDVYTYKYSENMKDFYLWV
jgi:hypothetical protein